MRVLCTACCTSRIRFTRPVPNREVATTRSPADVPDSDRSAAMTSATALVTRGAEKLVPLTVRDLIPLGWSGAGPILTVNDAQMSTSSFP